MRSITIILGFVMALSTSMAQVDFPLMAVPSDPPDRIGNFQIDLKIVPLSEGVFQLVSTLDLLEGAYIISPFSMDNFYLPYTSSIQENRFIKAASALMEFPSSEIEQDPYIEKEVRFIRTKTVFTQAFEIVHQVDFEVDGWIEFLVEPDCIPYDVTFTIKMKSGELSIENEKLFISAEYKP